MTDDSTIADYDAVTAADIAEFLHHLADLRIGAPGEDLAARAAFLTAKADLFTRIADQHAETDPGYATQVRQMARDTRGAAARGATAVPRQVGPNQRRTPPDHAQPDGARAQENSGASSG